MDMFKMICGKISTFSPKITLIVEQSDKNVVILFFSNRIMSGTKDWFVMTRHERRGAAVVLLMTLVALIVLWATRGGMTASTQREIKQMQALCAQADSINSSLDSQPKIKHKSKRKSDGTKRRRKDDCNRKAAPKPNKRPAEQRRIDPVPQF